MDETIRNETVPCVTHFSVKFPSNPKRAKTEDGQKKRTTSDSREEIFVTAHKSVGEKKIMDMIIDTGAS